MINLIGGILQFCAGVGIIGYGYYIGYGKWPRNTLDYYAGSILMVLGLIVVLLLRRG